MIYLHLLGFILFVGAVFCAGYWFGTNRTRSRFYEMSDSFDLGSLRAGRGDYHGRD